MTISTSGQGATRSSQASAEDPSSGPEPADRPAARPGGTGGTGGVPAQFQWFSTLWAMALVFPYSDSASLAVLPVLLAVLPALVLPFSRAAFALTVAAGIVVAAQALPTASNHIVLTLLIDLAIVAAALWVVATVHRRPPGGDPAQLVGRWLDVVGTPAGLVLLAVYFWTVFDKLNTGFLDPATSCAGTLLDQLISLNGLDPSWLSPAVVGPTAVGTVVVEVAILGLLAVPRWRRWGVTIGVGFHAVLAAASFYDFAAVVFAVYVLLVPRAVVASAVRSPALRQVALTGFAAHVLLSLGAGLAGTVTSPIGLTWHTLLVVTWYIAVGPFMVSLVRACHRATDTGSGRPRWRLRPVVLLLVPLLALANGATPYLGLKTVASYSMFSNLRTEDGQNNHLLPVGAVELESYQRDTVTITRLDVPAGADLGRAARWTDERTPIQVPWLELRRAAVLWHEARAQGVRIDYLRDGELRALTDPATDPELAAPLPWWQRRLLAFRAINSASAGSATCRW